MATNQGVVGSIPASRTKQRQETDQRVSSTRADPFFFVGIDSPLLHEQKQASMANLAVTRWLDGQIDALERSIVDSPCLPVPAGDRLQAARDEVAVVPSAP